MNCYHNHIAKIVAKITTNNGIVGYLGIVGTQIPCRFSLFDKPRLATPFSGRKEAEEAVKGYWQEKQTSGTVEYLLFDDDNWESQPLGTPVNPPLPEPTSVHPEQYRKAPNEAIMAMFRNRIKDLGAALERLGRGIDEKHLDYLYSPYASAAMASKSIADFADLFDSIIEELHACKSFPKLVPDPQKKPPTSDCSLPPIIGIK